MPPTLAQQAIVEQWRGEVIERIRTIKGTYVRAASTTRSCALFPKSCAKLCLVRLVPTLSVYQNTNKAPATPEGTTAQR